MSGRIRLHCRRMATSNRRQESERPQGRKGGYGRADGLLDARCIDSSSSSACSQTKTGPRSGKKKSTRRGTTSFSLKNVKTQDQRQRTLIIECKHLARRDGPHIPRGEPVAFYCFFAECHSSVTRINLNQRGSRQGRQLTLGVRGQHHVAHLYVGI